MSEDMAPSGNGAAVEDIKVLFPGTEIVVNGETIKVMPFFFGQHPKAFELIAPVVKSLHDADLLSIHKVGADIKFSMADGVLERLPEVIQELSGGLEMSINLLMFALKKPREWFDTIAGDDGYKLLFAVFQENADFFVKRILPMFGLVAGPQQVGEQSPPPSSEPATPGQPSSPTH